MVLCGMCSFFVIAVFVVALMPVMLLSLPSTKGWAGEMLVDLQLHRIFRKDAVIFHDLYFHNGRRSCQIDHLVVSRSGIFVIETKNYLGMVSGNAKDKYLYRSVLNMHYRTGNPVFQNEWHLEYLRKNLPFTSSNSDLLRSIIIFTPFTRLCITHNPGNIGVLSQLAKMINRYSSPECLSSVECQVIADEIRRFDCRRRSGWKLLKLL